MSTVTAVGTNFINISSFRIDYAACTVIQINGGATAPAVGDVVEWEGYIETDGSSVMASVLYFN
jgi:hypothetical protein